MSTMNRGNITYSQKSPDYIYYNIRIQGDSDTPSRAIFDENRVKSILDNPSEYSLSIVRFSVPTENSPLLFFPENGWSVTMSYNGSSVTEFLTYIPNAAVPGPYPGKDAVYTYSEVLQSLNAAYATAYTNLLALEPGLAGVVNQAPFVTLDPSTELFTMYAVTGYDSSVPTNPKIYMNAALYGRFSSMESFFETADLVQLLVYDRGLNTETIGLDTFYKMTGDFSTLELFNDVKQIVIASNSIPVRQELQGEQADVQERILTDFNVAGNYDRSTINFFPQGPLRYLDLESTFPLKRIQLEVYFRLANDELIPVLINEDSVLTIKIEFKRKIGLRLVESGL